MGAVFWVSPGPGRLPLNPELDWQTPASNPARRGELSRELGIVLPPPELGGEAACLFHLKGLLKQGCGEGGGESSGKL